jgi:iron complex outermembrane receptor protein
VKPEETNAFDLGARYTTRQIQAQATVWKIDYSNRIVSSFNADLGISLDRNVGQVKSWGAEGSIAFRPIPQVSLLALGSYIDAELQENIEFGSVKYNATSPITAPPAGLIFCDGAPPTATNTTVATCVATAGKMVAETPKWQFGGRATLEVGPAEFGVQAKRVSSRFATDANDVKVKGYTLVDLDARISAAPLGFKNTFLQLNVNNVFNQFYFGNISTQINAGGNPNFAVGSPRTFMATLNFGI